MRNCSSGRSQAPSRERAKNGAEPRRAQRTMQTPAGHRSMRVRLAPRGSIEDFTGAILDHQDQDEMGKNRLRAMPGSRAAG